MRFVRLGFHFDLQDATKTAAALRSEHDTVSNLAFIFESDLIDVSREQAQGKRALKVYAAKSDSDCVSSTKASVAARGQQRDFLGPPESTGHV